MKKGFTLIELLVVIAIIGILASVVLVGFGNTRDQARDARIQSAMTQIRTQAEIYYMGDGDYAYTGLTSDTAVSSLLNDITAQAGSAATVGITPDDYCVISALNASTYYFCVDSDGSAGTQTATTCTASYLCE